VGCSKPFDDLDANHSSSKQEHLKRISPYLVPGPEIWWKKTEEGFEFHDGRDAPDTNTMGPQLKHFRSTNLDQIYTNKESTWNDLIHGGTELPTYTIYQTLLRRWQISRLQKV
jgi:hypothetical protein